MVPHPEFAGSFPPDIPKVRGRLSLYAVGMQAPAGNSDTSSSFAGALAAFAAERADGETDQDDRLRDDVAVFSYEGAVRARAGCEPSDAAPVESARGRQGAEPPSPAAAEGTLKTACITIRMSEAECAQLKRRAAEAGLTVSAYLRSCTFEAEALRAQVKQALAELRSAAPDERRAATRAPRHWWRPWPHAGSRSTPA